MSAGELDALVAKLRKAFGPDLVSVILYGSAAVGDRHEKFSDYNILCVLSQISLAQLAASETVFRWWCGLGNPSPLLLTEHELRTSADCFAIETHDIRQHHRILDGVDIVSSLEVDARFHRAQVERELRSKLLRLRQKAAGILSDNAALRQLLVDSVSTFCVLFRHSLILAGEPTFGPKREIVEAARVRFGLDADPFVRLLDYREGRAKSSDVDPRALLTVYIAEIGRVIDSVDQLQNI
jgi:hypothetical protein